MKFSHVTIHVRNMDESIRFYRDIIGLSLWRSFNAGTGIDIAFLGDGGSEIELIHNSGKTDFSYGNSISLGFETDSVECMIETLRSRGITDIGDIVQSSPYVRFFFVRDPNGALVEFVEHIRQPAAL